jgi:hypothetical protein
MKLALESLMAMIGRQWPASASGGTAELLDEDDPEGMVILRNARGEPECYMPRALFEELRQRPLPVPPTPASPTNRRARRAARSRAR